MKKFRIVERIITGVDGSELRPPTYYVEHTANFLCIPWLTWWSNSWNYYNSCRSSGMYFNSINEAKAEIEELKKDYELRIASRPWNKTKIVHNVD